MFHWNNIKLSREWSFPLRFYTSFLTFTKELWVFCIYISYFKIIMCMENWSKISSNQHWCITACYFDISFHLFLLVMVPLDFWINFNKGTNLRGNSFLHAWWVPQLWVNNFKWDICYYSWYVVDLKEFSRELVTIQGVVSNKSHIFHVKWGDKKIFKR